MAMPCSPASARVPLEVKYLLLLLLRAPLADGSLLSKPTRTGNARPVTPTTLNVVVKPATFASPSKAVTRDFQEASPLSPQGAPYWFDERIHRFGNVGPGGRFHALVAPLVTRLIDSLSYNGVDVRARVHASIPPGATVLDLCCGTGFSTPAGATGVDTSPAFLSMANLIHPDRTFVNGNAETYGEPFSKDVVTIMFATHEMPRQARQRVLANAARIARQQVQLRTRTRMHLHAHSHTIAARRKVIIVDIDPKFKLTIDPTFKQDMRSRAQAESFLSGEPYVLEYLKHIGSDVQACARSRGWQSSESAVLHGHVRMWRMIRARQEFDI